VHVSFWRSHVPPDLVQPLKVAFTYLHRRLPVYVRPYEDDAESDFFLDVFRYIVPRLPLPLTDLRRLLHRIARCVAARWAQVAARQRAREVHIEEGDAEVFVATEPSPETEVGNRQEIAYRLQHLRSQLGRQQFQIVRLTLAGYSDSAIAAALGISKKQVVEQRSRALAKIEASNIRHN